jgi:hypothetical protein
MFWLQPYGKKCCTELPFDTVAVESELFLVMLPESTTNMWSLKLYTFSSTAIHDSSSRAVGSGVNHSVLQAESLACTSLAVKEWDPSRFLLALSCILATKGYPSVLFDPE